MMKGRVILLVLIFMSSGLATLPLISENSEGAELSFNSEAVLDGTILSFDTDNYSQVMGGIGDIFIADTAFDSIITANSYTYGPTGYNTCRAFVSFDTSSIPDDFTVIQATLNIKHNQSQCADNFGVKVFNTEYGAALTTADWNETGEIEGVLFSGYCPMPDLWLSIAVTPENLNLSGRTQYVLKHTLDGMPPPTGIPHTGHMSLSYFYSADSSYSPYLTVSGLADTGVVVTYNFTSPVNGTNHTSTIYPVEILNWNSSWEQLRYEVYLFNESYAHLDINASYVYQSCHPWLNVTLIDALNGTYNLTQTIVDFEWHHLWFLREKVQVNSWLHIALWHETIGEGFFWEKWLVMICPGPTWNNTTAQRVPNPNYAVPYGTNWTLCVYDYFGNEIVNYSVTANTYDIDVLIGIPVYTLQVINWRQGGSSLVAIYFNATGDPFTHSVPAGESWYMPVREGSYQLIITYMYWDNTTYTETIGAGFSYNVTIDGDYNFYIGENFISVTKYTVDGTQIDVDYIVTITNPALIIVPQQPALVPTEECQLDYDNNFPLFLDPYYVITAEVRIYDTNGTGAATLSAGELDTTLMSGTVAILSDELTVSASNTTATMIVNNTDTSTEVINTTAPAGATFDILNDHYAHRKAPLSVWVNNGGFSVRRVIRYRQSQSFPWYINQGGHLYSCTITVNNTQNLMIYEPHVYVAFANDTKPDLDRCEMYDVDNTIWLEKGIGYSVDYSGVSFMFANLTASTYRTFTIRYWDDNSTDYGTAWIDKDPSTPQWHNYDGQQYRYVYGTYQHQDQAAFTGIIKFSLDFSEAEYMDRGSIIVFDLTDDKELTKHSHWRLTDSSIEIMDNYVGTMQPGDSLSIGVLYKRTDDSTEEILEKDIIGGATLPLLIVIFALVLLIMGLVFRQNKDLRNDAKAWIGAAIVLFGILVGFVALVFTVS